MFSQRLNQTETSNATEAHTYICVPSHAWANFRPIFQSGRSTSGGPFFQFPLSDYDSL